MIDLNKKVNYGRMTEQRMTEQRMTDQYATIKKCVLINEILYYI